MLGAGPQAIDALTAILLLGPHIPLLFMGEEWGETRPFYFFTDFHGELGRLVRDGRRNEFRRWRSFHDPENRELHPRSQRREHVPRHQRSIGARLAKRPQCDRLERVGRLLEIRRREIVPRLDGHEGKRRQRLSADDCGFAVQWRLGDGSDLDHVCQSSATTPGPCRQPRCSRRRRPAGWSTNRRPERDAACAPARFRPGRWSSGCVDGCRSEPGRSHERCSRPSGPRLWHRTKLCQRSGEERCVVSDATKRGLLQALGVCRSRRGRGRKRASHLRPQPRPPAARHRLRDALLHAGLARRGRVWGITCQLYGLRSERNWGIGDFEDLAHLAELAAAAGADFVGVNPLHALFLAEPSRYSPYSPSSRRFLNPLYISVDALAPDAECRPIAVRSGSREATWSTTCSGAVSSSKRSSASIVASRVEAGQVEDSRLTNSARARGRALRFLRALRSAVGAPRRARVITRGWHRLARGLSQPESDEVERFAQENSERIDFHMWLQWIAETQLRQAQQRAIAAGMRIGLYLDLAVGVAPDGAETWSQPDAVIAEARLGCPPDMFNEAGQDWGLAPLSPIALAKQNFAPLKSCSTIHHLNFLMIIFLVTGGYGFEGKIVVSVDTDSNGNVYVLTFGEGVYKYNPIDGSYNKIINDQLGSPGALNAPLDLAIDNDDIIHIADGGFKLIKKFDTSGNSVGIIGVGAVGDGRDEFWQPTGLEFDNQNNLFVVDADRRDEDNIVSYLKIYYADGSFRSFQGTSENPIYNPYRVAANENYILISHAKNNGEVIVYNKDLSYNSTLGGIGSPGSLFIDKSNFIYAIDYGEEIDFGQVLKLFTGDIVVAFQLYPKITSGIERGEFKIQVYKPNLDYSSTLNDYPVATDDTDDDHIQFPLDITLDETCGKLFLNDAEVSGFNLNFNLEIYLRTPSYDITSPIANCVGDFELSLVDGSVSITVDDINNGSTDNCGIESITLSQSTFTEADVYNVIMTVTDQAGNKDTCEVEVTVKGEEVSNRAPTAVADSYTVVENQNLTEPFPGVLGNDTDPDDDALTAVLQTDVSNGTLTLNPNGSFTYTPDPDYTGPDSFTYFANDGELNSNIVTVSITVNPEPNQAPTAVADSYTVVENQTLTEPAPGILGNDTDSDDDALTAVLQTDVSNGTLTLNPNGSFTYTPDPDYTGPDSFTYFANDGELNSNIVTVSITVNPEPNQAPTAVADSYTVVENQTLTEPAPGILGNDTDSDDDALTAVLQTDVSNGTLTLKSNGSFTYTPDPDFTGPDSFTYFANDGELNSNIVTVTITVNPEPNLLQQQFQILIQL